MAQPVLVASSRQDVLNAIAEVSKENGDNFKLKVSRKTNAGASPEHVGVFDEATWEMISDAEAWIAPLCGGGIYQITIWDMKNSTNAWTITTDVIPGPTKKINPNITRTTGWRGPSVRYTTEDANHAAALGAGEELRDQRLPTQRASDLPGLFGATQELEQKRREVEAAERRAELAQMKRDNEERERRREEAEKRREESDKRTADLFQQLLLRPPPAPVMAPPGPSVAEIIAGIMSAAAPIVTVLIQSNAESARRIEELRHQDAARQDEIRRLEASRPLIPPEVVSILERSSQQANEQTKHFSALLEAQANSQRANAEIGSIAQRSMIQTLAEVMQLQIQPKGEDAGGGVNWGKALADAASGFAVMMENNRRAAAGVGGMPQGAPVNTPGGGLPLQNGTLPNGVVHGQQAPPQAAAPGVAGVAADGGVVESEALNRIEERIRRKEDPIQVCADLVNAIASDTATQLEMKADGGLQNTMGARMQDFMADKANEEYLTALYVEFAKQAASRGIAVT